jgi:hypothetical protein
MCYFYKNAKSSFKFRLEEEEKFLNAESYYKKALALDETFKDAEDALQKLHKYMQVILYFLLEI